MTPQRPTQNDKTAATSENATPAATRNSVRQEASDGLTDSDMMNAADEECSDEPGGSQSSKPAEELLSHMVAGARKRHNAQTKKVLGSYSMASSDIQECITTLFDEHAENSSTAHEAQLKRLNELFNQKAKLEEAMEAKSMALRASYNAHSRDLESVLNTQIRELN